MSGETYGLIAPPSGSTFVAGHTARASQIEQVRQNAAILGKPRYIDLGGDEQVGHVNTSYGRLTGAIEVELCEEDFRGLSVDLVVWVRVANAAGTVRLRLRNTDDGADVAEMAAAVADTTLTRYEVTGITLPTGTIRKWCRLEIVAGDADYPAYGFGRLRYSL